MLDLICTIGILSLKLSMFPEKQYPTTMKNSEVVWVDIEEAINRNDVPELTKTLLKHIFRSDGGLLYTHYYGKGKNAPYSLWCM